ncbi:hypothetical protein [Vannielia litorea]|uniref:hypothetical protein n=1 Tax=Vannielia litorea TaxID=1217970 RepID=UPI001C953AB6|nr:hypothetical protein [Vannielia litorea]MBY6049522.1 hypothetical protein [Vannielia litorea]MBY6076936.1 hypothetical protein [Vannielia litorea]
MPYGEAFLPHGDLRKDLLNNGFQVPGTLGGQHARCAYIGAKFGPAESYKHVQEHMAASHSLEWDKFVDSSGGAAQDYSVSLTDIGFSIYFDDCGQKTSW